MSRFGKYSELEIMDLPDFKDEQEITSLGSDAETQKPLYAASPVRSATRKNELKEQLKVDPTVAHIYQINPITNDNDEVLTDPIHASPTLTDSEKPDVRMSIELVNYHAKDMGDEQKGATLRMDIGQDDRSESRLDPLFWTVAAGLDIYNASKRDRDETNLRSHFSNDLFARQPIEVGGGLAQLKFEIMENEKPPWWKDLFGLLESDAGRQLTSAFGFPGLLNDAVGMLDDLLDKFAQDQEPILSSPKFILALNKHAKDEFEMGNNRVKIPVLNEGFSLLVPRGFKAKFEELDPIFYPSYGVALPRDMALEDYLAGGLDPLADIPYAVLRVRAKELKIDNSI